MAENSNLENLLVPELAKLGTKAKSTFTRAHDELGKQGAFIFKFGFWEDPPHTGRMLCGAAQIR